MGTQSITRTRKIAKVKVALKQLQIEDDAYRALLVRVTSEHSRTPKRSLADCAEWEVDNVLKELARLGFKARKPVHVAPRERRPLDQTPTSEKVRALWLFLHQLGLINDPSERALASYVRRIAGVDDLRWVSANQAHKLIESMKKWALRKLPDCVELLAHDFRECYSAGRVQLSPVELDSIRLAVARGLERGTFDPLETAWTTLTTVLSRKGSNDAAAV